jgi:trans-aconitate methyltransferase
MGATVPDLRWSTSEIVRRFADTDLGDDGRSYLRFHLRRFAGLTALVDRLAREAVATTPGALRILDVGPAVPTTLLRDRLAGTDAVVDSLGWADGRFPAGAGDTHHHLDFDQAGEAEHRPALEGYHVIVCGEVIEHLTVSPVALLALLRDALLPGGRLVVQTPNAVSIGKRLALLAGRNPFELLRADRANPGHFREYTVREVRALAEAAGLRTITIETQSPFATGSWKGALRQKVGDRLGAGFREGITGVFGR